MDYPAYPDYRESGIEWLGKIPDHWEVMKLSHLYDNIGSGTTPSTTNDLWYQGDIPWVTTGELRENVINSTEKFISKEAFENHSALKIYPVGSVVLAMYGATIGRVSVLGIAATTNQACCVMSDSPLIINRFLFYWFQAFKSEIVQLSSGGGQPNINQEKVSSLKIPVPSIEEQYLILEFLDHKTQQIDQLLAKKQTLIDKLNEQRIALITHAVTKGLNPDVTLKDSGVEWLGKVPEHWEVSKLGYFSESLQTGPFGSQIHAEEYIDAGIPLINPADIINGTLRYNPRVTVDDATADRLERHQLKEGDIVIARRGEMGRAGLTKKENIGWLCGTGSLRARLETEKLMPEYLLQLFSLSGTADYLSLQSVGSTMDNLNTSILNQLPIIIPLIEEQREIVEYLDRETARIDRMVELNQQTIDKLKEYRTALITAAVTGKIDVRNWQQEKYNHATP